MFVHCHVNVNVNVTFKNAAVFSSVRRIQRRGQCDQPDDCRIIAATQSPDLFGTNPDFRSSDVERPSSGLSVHTRISD